MSALQLGMNIAQIAPLYEAVPPWLYGGTERVVAHLCDSLVELGHEVTLFAAADAHTRARLVATRDQSLRLDPAPLKSELSAHLIMLDEVRKVSDQFDILHFHVDLLHFPMFEQEAHRTITTVHGRLDLKDLGGAYNRWPQYGLISISDHQRRPLPNAGWLATIPHGVPVDRYQFSPRPAGGYLAFLGRASPEKRLDLAIQLARSAGLPLKIAAKVDSVDRVYFDSVIRPLLDVPGVECIGEIGDGLKSAFLGNAIALLFPINWPEPFGLVMIEAMACGTPVIAWKCGSVPEVIDDGITGYIVDSEQEAIEAIGRAPGLSRRRIRDTFEQRFTTTIMARRYLEVYERLQKSNALQRSA